MKIRKFIDGRKRISLSMLSLVLAIGSDFE